MDDDAEVLEIMERIVEKTNKAQRDGTGCTFDAEQMQVLSALLMRLAREAAR